jgi:hypothetical protein
MKPLLRTKNVSTEVSEAEVAVLEERVNVKRVYRLYVAEGPERTAP